MKKGLILLLLIGLIIHTALGQIVCGYEQTNTLESKTTSHIENGGVCRFLKKVDSFRV